MCFVSVLVEVACFFLSCVDGCLLAKSALPIVCLENTFFLVFSSWKLSMIFCAERLGDFSSSTESVFGAFTHWKNLNCEVHVQWQKLLSYLFWKFSVIMVDENLRVFFYAFVPRHSKFFCADRWQKHFAKNFFLRYNPKGYYIFVFWKP